VKRRDALWAAGVALAVSALYLVTLRPDVGGTEDSPKFQFLGQVLGTAHTPGYPFYTLVTWLFTRPDVGTLAWRVNLFSAVCGVWSCLCIFWLARRLDVSRPLAAVAALAAATGFPLWSNSITAEVYSLSALMSALTILLLIAWIQTGARWRLYAACAVFAAGMGNHLTIVGLLPAALVYGIVKDRSVLSPRVAGTTAVIGALGVLQYGFIALRTLQGAPYLEARATSLLGVYHVIIAKDVSWARFYQEADKVVGIEVPMLLEGLRVHMGTVTVALVVFAILWAIRRRQAEVLLITGGAAGTLGMIANLWGDVVGFITPVIVLLWPLTAWGLETAVRAVRNRDGAVAATAAVAMVLPVWNVMTIHPSIERLRQPGEGPAMRAMYARLPAGAAVVAHNYWIARIFNYLDFSNEYDPDPTPELLDNDAGQVRAAVSVGKPVYALDGALPWLKSQGLQFDPSPISRQPFERWIAGQPAGTLVAVAAAGRLLPIEWLPPDARSVRRANFGALFWTLGATPQTVPDDANAEIRQPFGPGGRVVAIAANDDGLMIQWGDDVIAAGDRGLAAVVISPEGRVRGRWLFTAEEELGVQVPPAAFLYSREVPCEVLRTSQRVDVSRVLAEGGWYATVEGAGIVEISLDGGSPAALWRARLAHGGGDVSVHAAERRLRLEARPGTRAVFHLSVPIPEAAVVATLETSDHAVRVCQAPAEALPPTGAVDTGPDAEGLFGAGWHTPEDAGTQHFRWSARTSTLRWTMEQPADVRWLLRMRAAHAGGATVTAAWNGVPGATCLLPPGAWAECQFAAPASATRAGLNQLTLSSDTAAASDRATDARELAFVLQPSRVRVSR
jgi:hypothetical protein